MSRIPMIVAAASLFAGAAPAAAATNADAAVRRIAFDPDWAP